jgi:serine/threonine protein kinase
VAILHSLRHPRILTLMGVCRPMNPQEGYIGLIFELMEGGSLHDLLHRVPEEEVEGSIRPLDLAWRLNICLDIAEGMRFLHSSGILHRDLKSANVLLSVEGRCKIADFGLSTFKDSAVTQTAGVLATPAWTDPEVLKGARKHSEASDMYSFGVVVWEVFSGEIPWAGESVMRILAMTAYEGQRLPIRDSFPESVKGFLASAFNESTERPSFSSVFRLFQDLVNSQNGRRRTSSSTAIDLASVKQIVRECVKEGVEEGMGDMVVVVDGVFGQHFGPLHEALTKHEGSPQIARSRNVFRELHQELLALDDPQGLSGLAEFWALRMQKLEALVRSSSCDEAKIVKEMRMTGSLLTTRMLELDLRLDPEDVVRELTIARDELIAGTTAHNEEATMRLLAELRRMISAE